MRWDGEERRGEDAYDGNELTLYDALFVLLPPSLPFFVPTRYVKKCENQFNNNFLDPGDGVDLYCYKRCASTLNNGFHTGVRKCKKKVLNRPKKLAQCKDGYKQSGAFCYKRCKHGETDLGLTCYKPKFEKWSLAKIGDKFAALMKKIESIPGIAQLLQVVETVINGILAGIFSALKISFPTVPSLPLPSASDLPVGDLMNALDALDPKAAVAALVDGIPNELTRMFDVLQSKIPHGGLPSDLDDLDALAIKFAGVSVSALTDIADRVMNAGSEIMSEVGSLVDDAGGSVCSSWKEHTVPITAPLSQALGQSKNECPAELSFKVCNLDFGPLSKAIAGPLMRAMKSDQTSASGGSFLEEASFDHFLEKEGRKLIIKLAVRSCDDFKSLLWILRVMRNSHMCTCIYSFSSNNCMICSCQLACCSTHTRLCLSALLFPQLFVPLFVQPDK